MTSRLFKPKPFFRRCLVKIKPKASRNFWCQKKLELGPDEKRKSQELLWLTDWAARAAWAVKTLAKSSYVSSVPPCSRDRRHHQEWGIYDQRTYLVQRFFILFWKKWFFASGVFFVPTNHVFSSFFWICNPFSHEYLQTSLIKKF
jgi:hypothetical protein